jgi:hypothetical protein
MPIGEKKYQKLFEEAQADAIRLRQERDRALGCIRLIGRMTSEQWTEDICRNEIAGKEIPIDDAERLTWLIKQGPPGAAEDDLGLTQDLWEMACSMVAGHDPEANSDQRLVRAAIDGAIAAQKAKPQEVLHAPRV